MNIRKIALVALILLTSGAAHADVSGNLGFASDYYYRGIFQAESSASGGLDYESDGFYVGTWAADVKDGLEIDGYFGYGGELADGLGYSVGYTGYFYTGDFDDTYQEINLGSSLGLFALDVAVGTYKNFSGPTQNYTHYSLSVEKSGFFGKYAAFSQDFAGTYFEAGYSATVAEIDLGITLLFNDKDLSGDSESDQALIFTVSRSFDLNFK
ncbi:MAG: TorF family putative porin [Woeseiaceae bacterium]|nr:TorF family putative porin [Woeseiaceae bacterium]